METGTPPRDTAWAKSQENVEIVRRCFGFWGTRDVSAILEVAHPDLVLDVSRRMFNPAVYHGLEGFRRFANEVDEIWESFQFDPEELIDAGDRVFASVRISGRGRESGVEAEMREFSIWTFREGKLARIAGGYRGRDQALEAAGLRE